MDVKEFSKELLQTIHEMMCGVMINSDICEKTYEMEKLKSKLSDMKYNELLKQLKSEEVQEIISSRSVYDSTETLIERIETVFNATITDESVIKKLDSMQEEIDQYQKDIDSMQEDLKDLTSFLSQLPENDNIKQKIMNCYNNL